MDRSKAPALGVVFNGVTGIRLAAGMERGTILAMRAIVTVTSMDMVKMLISMQRHIMNLNHGGFNLKERCALYAERHSGPVDKVAWVVGTAFQLAYACLFNADPYDQRNEAKTGTGFDCDSRRAGPQASALSSLPRIASLPTCPITTALKSAP